MTLEETVKNLNALGIAYKVLESGTDGAALAMPEYGRILGLWSVWRGENAFHINPEFFRSLGTGAKQTEWVNPGGDRMWLYPEDEFFRAGEIPPDLDPGTYSGSSDKGLYVMENRGDVWAGKTGARIVFRIQRRFRVYTEKELVALWGMTYLRQAGYDEETVLEIQDSPIEAGAWNAVQLSPGGRAHMQLDTPLGAKPAAGGFVVKDGCAVIPAGGTQGERVWLKASQVKPRAAYVLESAETGRAQLVLKEFEKGLQTGYARESDAEGAPQYSGAAGFRWAGRHSQECELGFRSPAAVGSRKKKKTVWKHSTWAFSGRIEEVAELLRRVTA
jgi:hypothetical protein